MALPWLASPPETSGKYVAGNKKVWGTSHIAECEEETDRDEISRLPCYNGVVLSRCFFETPFDKLRLLFGLIAADKHSMEFPATFRESLDDCLIAAVSINQGYATSIVLFGVSSYLNVVSAT